MIRIRHLRKRFGEKVVLDDLSLDIRPGEILFVLGRSGTGKSVLLKHLVGLLRPDSGEMTLEGKSLVGLSEEAFFEVRRQVGMIFQQPALLDSLTVYENVAFGLRAAGGRPEADEEATVAEALARVNLSRSLFPRYPTELSVGTQKRVSLARTVCLRPGYLLFDEPTTGLDSVATTLVNRLIRDVTRGLGAAAVVVSHDMHCALGVADRIILLDRGRIALEGTAEDFRRSELKLARDFLREALAHDGGAP